MGFQCVHCGQCCNDTAAQINISLGDIIRISKYLDVPIGEVLKKMGMKPFAEHGDDNKFTVELGINIPCEFRKGKGCSIYPARPLNCRIFPYFIIGEAPNEEIKELIDPSHKCITDSDTDYTEEEKKQYREYADYIGNLILKEAEITELFLDRYGLRQEIILPAYMFPGVDDNDMMARKEMTVSKIKMAMEIMKKDKYKDLNNKIQNFIIEKDLEKETATASEINEKSNL